ncbi:MAG TPA: OmpA family protein [Desulforhopalus sp.]|nr:OmpA family protein [Desulforhopalus sp.]
MRRFLFLMLGCFALAGCGQKATFVLLPDPDGTVGEIMVTSGQNSHTLNQAHQAVSIKGDPAQPGKLTTMPESQIRALFGKAIAVQPLPPAKFLLYFEFDSVRPNSAATAQLELVLQAVTERKSRDISINGHTDRTGPVEYNDQLALQRANEVKMMLVQRGIDPASIVTTSHGMHNPLIPTASNVAEPRNRRVEVIVR